MDQIDHLIKNLRLDLLSKGYTETKDLLRQLSKQAKEWKKQSDPALGKKVSGNEQTFYALLGMPLKGNQLPIELSLGFEYNPSKGTLSPISVQASLFNVTVRHKNTQMLPFELPLKKDLELRVQQALLIDTQKQWKSYKLVHPLPNYLSSGPKMRG